MIRQLCSAGLAFMGFSMSLIIGLLADNSYITVVARALKVMMLFYLLGLLLSAIGVRVIQENFDQELERMEASRQDKATEVAGSNEVDASKPAAVS